MTLTDGDSPPPRRGRKPRPDKRGGDRQTGQALAEQAAREARVAELKLAGLTFEQIAAAVGYADKTGAQHAWKRVKDRYIGAPTREAWELELARLERLHAAVWADALRGKPAAVETVLAISRQRSRLYGYDGSFSIDEGGETTERAEVAQLVTDLLALPVFGGPGA